MKIGIIHTESTYYAGAERVLDYYLQGLVETPLEVVVFYGRGSKVEQFIPAKYRKVALDGVQGFHPVNLWRAAAQIKAVSIEEGGFDLLHAWAARGWDLAGLAGWRTGVPVLGTLHDAPDAGFISPTRQAIMRFSANHLLKRYACVSKALLEECKRLGYPMAKAGVIHNGLPDRPVDRPEREEGRIRLGFLGAFIERKGVRELLKILDHLWNSGSREWELLMAGGAIEDASNLYMGEIRQEFGNREWWKCVLWPGWLEDCHPFLSQLDLLIVPSSGFDPLPTVILEACRAGTPVLGAGVGGIPEMIVDGKTGWTFDPCQAAEAASRLRGLIERPDELRNAGTAARKRFEDQFSVRKMVAEYTRLYSTLV